MITCAPQPTYTEYKGLHKQRILGTGMFTNPLKQHHASFRIKFPKKNKRESTHKVLTCSGCL